MEQEYIDFGLLLLTFCSLGSNHGTSQRILYRGFMDGQEPSSVDLRD